jgi:hypothetical protein
VSTETVAIQAQDSLSKLIVQLHRLAQRASTAERDLERERQETGRLRTRVEELEALPDPVITMGKADDRRGFVVLIDGKPVGQPVTYDDFGWLGIDVARALVVAVVEAFGSEVTAA